MALRVVLSKCFGFLALGALVAGCVVSPQPSPPDSVVLAGRLIDLNPGVELAKNVIGFHAGPGAVSPPVGVVIVTNLDTSDAPSVAAVQSDGSFEVAVPGHAGDSYRFQAKDGDVRSDPFDLAVDATDTAVQASSQGPTCLVTEPARWIAFAAPGTAHDLVIRNQCPGTLAVAAPHLRRGLAGFSFSPAAPLDLAAGETATITLHAGDGAEVEDTLLLDITGPTAARRAVTLTVPDR